MVPTFNTFIIDFEIFISEILESIDFKFVNSTSTMEHATTNDQSSVDVPEAQPQTIQEPVNNCNSSLVLSDNNCLTISETLQLFEKTCNSLKIFYNYIIQLAIRKSIFGVKLETYSRNNTQICKPFQTFT